MSDIPASTPAVPQSTNQAPQAPTEAQTIPGQKSQAELEKMSGAELAAYFEEQKSKGSTQKPTKPTRQLPTEKGMVSDPIKEAAKEATEARKYKVKVDGQELEVDESELLRGYSHQKAANKILQQGAAARKQAEEFIAMMKDPEKFWEVAKKIGHDPRKQAEEYLARQLEDELLDPRDRELKEAKMRLKQMEEMDRAQKEAMEAKRNEVLKQKYAKDYSDQFVTALQETGLPPTKPMVAEMAKYVSRAAKIGFKMTPNEAAQLVQEDIRIAHQRLVGDADGETLIRLLGDQVANKVRKYDTQRLKNPEQDLRTPSDQQDLRNRARPTSGKRMSPKEWREYNRK